ncbi:hypothetical protein BD414DRAFT_512420 [Trametes punicea]|nr:hypothetical protein BD414DRAFT_512420 [Trametes punicea]
MDSTFMVILWRNEDGSVTLSQRQGMGLAKPIPIGSPAQGATLSHLSDSRTPSVDPPILAFDIPNDDDAVQDLIRLGVGYHRSPIEQHLNAGRFTLNLARDTGLFPPLPLLLVAYATFSALGFLVFLPIGALLARWTRVYSPRWLSAHCVISAMLGLPAVCIGWALGPLAVAQEGKAHVVTAHLICGIVLFGLYLGDVGLGTVVYMHRKDIASHPARNIVHVLLGIVIFGLSVFQVGVTHLTLVGPTSI